MTRYANCRHWDPLKVLLSSMWTYWEGGSSKDKSSIERLWYSTARTSTSPDNHFSHDISINLRKLHQSKCLSGPLAQPITLAKKHTRSSGDIILVEWRSGKRLPYVSRAWYIKRRFRVRERLIAHARLPSMLDWT